VHRIGELAQHAGVTVRALHHYDELGLLTPSERSQGGHRLYAAADVQRLYRLLALRGLGLPLEEIGPLLEREGAVAETVRRHLARVEHQMDTLGGLRSKLTRLLDALDGGDESSAQFLEALEAMSMFEKYYTPEQLEQLAERKAELGDDAITAGEDAWRALFAELREHRLNGTDPADPAVQELSRRAGELVKMFTGGDPAIEASLQRMYETEGPERASRGMADAEDLAYLEAARQARLSRS
jgi:DNA-binding transcriptional MerR regulator